MPALCAALIGAALFVAYAYATRRDAAPVVAILAALGAMVGVLAAAELAPERFRRPQRVQVGAGVAGCVTIAAVLGAGYDGYGLAVAVGVLIGLLPRVILRLFDHPPP